MPCNGTYKAQLWGASGGGADPGSGGDGGFISGNMTLTKDTVLYYIIGECGYATDLNDNTACPQNRLTVTRTSKNYSYADVFGAYAVQGFGGNANGKSGGSLFSGSGGGATLLYLNNNYNTVSNLILIAGGGGGASDGTNASGTSYSYGGYYAGHGNNNGGSGQGTGGTVAGGGTQSAGGAASSGGGATAGSYLQGGIGGTSDNAGGGGGGGYYGGGGGNENISGGGGGSSYVNTSRATQNTSETATVKVGGDKNNDGVSGEMKITLVAAG